MEPNRASRPGAKRSCADARRYVDERLSGGPRAAAAACEGACAKGELARMAVNALAYRRHATSVAERARAELFG